jgi:hypothetical protein
MIDLNSYAVIDYTIEKYFNYCSNFTFQLQQNRKEIHQPGFHDCFIKRKSKTIFMHIDKCASSTMSNVLKNNNFCDMSFRVKNVNKIRKFFIKNNYKFYAIIREPKDRYISGLQEFIKRYNPPKEFIVFNLKNNKFIFDEHTSPQHCFLFLCEDNCNYLKLDENISEKISNIIGLNIKLPVKNSSQKNIKNICKELFEKYCEQNIKFYELYNKDFELYDISL